MREKINKAARGEFTYSVPKIKLSITELTISVNAGEIVRGEFVVSNDQEEDMPGCGSYRQSFFTVSDRIFSWEAECDIISI